MVHLAEGLRERDVGLMVGQPERDFGDARRELFDLDAVELVDVELGELVDGVERHFVLCAVQFEEDFEFEFAEFPVGDDEEVAAAAGRIEEAEFAEFVLKLLEARGTAGGLVGFDGFKFLPEIVETSCAMSETEIVSSKVCTWFLTTTG